MSEMINGRVKNIMSTVFELPLNQITNDSTMYSIPKWDSLNHMRLVIALEEEFNIKFDQEEMETFITFKIVSATIASYL